MDRREDVSPPTTENPVEPVAETSTIFDNVKKLEILREFEPIICYTRGEQFFPIDVDRYVKECSLWIKPGKAPDKLLVPQGNLSIDNLGDYQDAHPDDMLYLKFIEPLDIVEHTRYTLDNKIRSYKSDNLQDRFQRGGGRLARVGYSSRLVDALFSLTLLWRGRVPGDTALAAELAYQRMQEKGKSYTYYGRIIRQNGWVILQYWYFYPFNNWRSGFYGVNDHEGDWEMVCIYCSENDPTSWSKLSHDHRIAYHLTPQWVAYASHDFSGDDLRRRWDDNELEKIDHHPIVYAGAGSHASYFSKGEYMAEVELPFLKPYVRIVDWIQEVWVNFLHQAGSQIEKPEFNVFRIPFIDYARGDGVSIGHSGTYQWDAKLIDQKTSWVVNYRGLWGLYARDPIAGENAPAGPVYTREGNLRRRWYDPLGWAGMDRTPPPDYVLQKIIEQRKVLNGQKVQWETEIKEKSKRLQQLGVELSSLPGNIISDELEAQVNNEVKNLSKQVRDLRFQMELLAIRLHELEKYRKRVLAGDRGPIRAHIRRAHTPLPETSSRFNIFVELFAAVNIGFLIVAVVLIILFARQYLLYALATLIGSFMVLEAAFRRQITQLINAAAIGLAVISFLVIVYEFFWQIVIFGVIMAGLFIIWENLRELRS